MARNTNKWEERYVSKSADLDPKTNLTTNTETSAVATVERLTVFGSPQLLEGEDPGTYDDFLSRVYAAVKPVDIASRCASFSLSPASVS
jgi:hypothetical protein